jgi:hypothetical protein
MTVLDAIFPIVKMRDLPPQDGGKQVPAQECIANISTAERRKRLIPAIVEMVLATIILGVMMATGVDRLWRLGLFILFAAATSGYFQFRDHT